MIGAHVELVPAFGATDIRTSFDTSIRVLSNLLAIGVLVDSAIAAWWRLRRGDGAHLVLVATGVMITLTAVGRVFSPQYLLWSVAPVAIGLAIAPQLLRASAILLGVSIGLAHLVYPVLFYDYLAARPWAVSAGVARNLALLGAGLLAIRAAGAYGSGLPAVEEHEGVESVEADVLVGPDR